MMRCEVEYVIIIIFFEANEILAKRLYTWDSSTTSLPDIKGIFLALQINHKARFGRKTLFLTEENYLIVCILKQICIFPFQSFSFKKP